MPLDWLEEDETQRNKQTVALALVKQPAVVPHDHATYGGTILVNPGGPGDSGVLHIQRNGLYLQGMMDSDKKHFEIMSFDPRGMSNSVPSADCYRDATLRAMADFREETLGVPDIDSNASLARHKAFYASVSGHCANSAKDGQPLIHEYMSTASVARDMLQMVDKLKVWKEKQPPSSQDGHSNNQKPLEHVSRGDDRLLYYGTSYGTFLGQTFISMFPGRVRRMILDGVVVPEDYIAGDWCPNLEDTTKTIDYFYQTCFEAGDKCALYAPSDKSWHDVKDKIESLISSLNAQPVHYSLEGTAPGFITGLDIRARMMDPIYGPLDLYDGLAKTYADALTGNYTSLLNDLGVGPAASMCGPTDRTAYTWLFDAHAAVRCGDAIDLRDKDFSYWRKYMSRCQKLSPEMGNTWASIGCGAWQIRPKHRFEGPFKTPEADAADVEGRPSAPILFLSSKYDPVTPVHSAHTASKSHPGSRVLVQDSVGHCTLLSAPSKCTWEKMGAYMDTGALPDEGTVCEAGCVPWEHCSLPKAQFPR